MKTKSTFAPEVMCVVACRDKALVTIGHGNKIRTYAGGSPTIKKNGHETITGKNVLNRMMKHFDKSDAFINTTVRELQACFGLTDDQFAAQPTRKALSIRQLMAKAG